MPIDSRTHNLVHGIHGGGQFLNNSDIAHDSSMHDRIHEDLDDLSPSLIMAR
jgi:hypothetical protein